jgi:AraC-like DNA-binding protein
MHAVPLLERQRIFYSRDPEETRVFLQRKEFRFDLPRGDARRLDAHINGVYLPGGYVGYIQYGSPVTTRANPARSDYWVQFPIRGNIEVAVGSDSVVCGRNRAAVSSPTQGIAIRSELDSARLNLSLTASVLTRQLEALLGDTVDAPIEFAPEMNLAEGYGRTIAAYLRLAVAEFEQAGTTLWPPIMMTQFEQFIMTGLLLSQPHNYSEALRRLERPIMPRAVKRAIDFVQANLQAPITLAELVATSGVAGRTLFKHFRDFKGTSPMRYLRDIRLDRVREMLRSAAPQETVIDIAMSFGFSHMGRFSAQYRRRFGENPSATLSRRR